MQQGVHLGGFAGPVGFYECYIQAVHGAAEFVTVEDCGFVRLAGEAPVGGRIDEHGAFRLRKFFDERGAVTVPTVGCHLFLHTGVKVFRSGCIVLRGDDCKPDGRNNNDASSEGYEFAFKGGSRRREFPDNKAFSDACRHDNGEHPDACHSRLFVHKPKEPCDGREEQYAHHLLQANHPRSRFREYLEDFREGAHEYVGEGKPETRRRKEKEQHRGAGGEGESHGGAEEGRRTGRT